MILRNQWCQVLEIMNEFANKELRLPNDTQWVERLQRVGFDHENLDAVTYVLSAIIDSSNRENYCMLDSSGDNSWSWILFKDANVGVEFFHRLENAIQQKSDRWIWYWIGIRMGFRGQWIDDDIGFQKWRQELSLPPFPEFENAIPSDIPIHHSIKKILIGVSLLLISCVYYGIASE